MSPRSTREVLESHLALRAQQRVEDDIERNYSPDVVLLTGTGPRRGPEGVRGAWRELDEYVGTGASFEYANRLVEDDFGLLEWEAFNDGRKVCDGADSFVVRDGRIVFQSIHYTVAERDGR